MKSLETIVKEFSVKHDCLFTLAKKLTSIGTPKACISASRLCCRLASYIPSKFNNDVVKILTDNAAHKMIQVRVETAISLREILVEGGFYEFAALNALKRLVKDPQSSVQVFAFETLCWRTHSKQYFQTAIYPLIASCLEAKNWRIRYVLVRQLAVILNSLDAKNRKPIVAYFARCLADPEAEVSIRAIQILKTVLPMLDVDDIVDKILPELNKLVTNESVEIRLALCTSISSLTPFLTKTPDALNQVKTMVANLNKDANTDVRAKLLLNIDPFLKVMASQTTNLTFMGAVHELLADKNWKVRAQGIKALELLVVKFPEEFAQDEKMLKSFNDKLTDRIAAIRKATLMSLKAISADQGASWCEKNLLPMLHAYIDNPNYLYRFNFLLGVNEIFQLLPPASQAREAELVVKLTRDPVANLRFQALLVLLKFAQIFEDKQNEERLRKVSDFLLNDGDLEVRRLAKAVAGSKDLKSIVERGPECGG